MAISEPKSAHLREVLLFAFNWKKSATEAHRMLEEVYGDHALSKSQCYRWFKKFQSGDFELDNEPHGKPPQRFEDDELQALLDEDSTQMQEKLAKQLQVSQENARDIASSSVKALIELLDRANLMNYAGVLDRLRFLPIKKMDQRTCIKFCVKNEIKCADAFRMLTVAYGEATLDRSNVYRWYKMFSEGREDVNDEGVPDARALQQQTKKLMKWRK
ncbi:hypothetical protein LAZ67_14000945 [Cordylochernes scorpioides]|uniref:Mos1 transposase HTH domain-containing protein n=1 Tax=Cordylochernes scorpioides TaxID=51811 RepID=A0ABY6L5T3_9ARAC|nr:hypothetical protein LAZ67_14000945 [Cordylochernes scorpioides]